MMFILPLAILTREGSSHNQNECARTHPPLRKRCKSAGMALQGREELQSPA